MSKASELINGMSWEAWLMLHIFYEFQHLAGAEFLTVGRATDLCNEALSEFGGYKEAVDGIRDRCGLTAIKE